MPVGPIVRAVEILAKHPTFSGRETFYVPNRRRTIRGLSTKPDRQDAGRHRFIRRGAIYPAAATYWAREAADPTAPPLPPSPLNVDAIHAALGFVFTAIWVLVGQILVANR